jgi:hypothetical protein
MADQFVTWVSAIADIRSAGIKDAFIKLTGDGGYYPLGNIRDAKLTIKSQTKPDTMLRPWGWGMVAEAVIHSIQAASTEIKLLDSIAMKLPVAVSFGLSDALWFEDTSLMAPTWKLICDPDFNDFRVIEYTFKSTMTITESTAALKVARATLTGGSSVDALYALGTVPVTTDQVPNGLAKIEMKMVTDASYVDFGRFTGGKYTFETVSVPSGGRQQPAVYAIKFTFDASLLSTDYLKLALGQVMSFIPMDIKLTHMDGLVVTVPSTNVGIVSDVTVSGNIDKPRTMDIHAEGMIPWNGTYFMAGTTAWDSMWV